MLYPVSLYTVSFARAYAATKGTYIGFKVGHDMLPTDSPSGDLSLVPESDTYFQDGNE